MKKNLRSILVIGLALLCVALAVYVKNENVKTKAASEHKAGLIAEEKKKTRRAKLEADWIEVRPTVIEHYIVHQPVSEEIKKSAAKLDIEISPFFESQKLALIVIPQEKIPVGKYDSEFARLLKESSASNVEVATESEKTWKKVGVQWEKEREQREKQAEILRNRPEVAEANRRYEERMKEVKRMKGISMAESTKLQFEAVKENDDEMAIIRKQLFANPVRPAPRWADQ